MLLDSLSLVYPTLCAACGNGLYWQEEHICTKCLYELPKTNFHQQADNPVARLLWGRADVSKATAYYRFNKGGKVQELIHQFKYRGQKEAGITVGKHFAFDLKEVNWLDGIDVIIPVPLHPVKLKKRGYNQAEYFAKGISEISGIPVESRALVRISATQTQTRKSRYLRWKNVESIFKVQQAELIQGRNILLVDDVITTGSTLEACAQQILKIPDTKLSIAAMAFANM